jgi:uncharacterized protein YfaS (alpha-2-macroglobulin family)
MTYSIAVVDEGLLDLTRFKTPNAWDSFTVVKLLGVKLGMFMMMVVLMVVK